MRLTDSLPDPRRTNQATLPLHRLAEDLLAQREPGRMLRAELALDTALLAMVDAGDEVAWQKTLATAPNPAVARVLAKRLDAAFLHASAPGARHAMLFAMPIVLVAGSRAEVEIPGGLTRIDEVRRLLMAHGLLHIDMPVMLYDRLVTRDALMSVPAHTLMQWHQTTELPADGIPLDLPAAPIAVKGDGVFLRYLIGVAMSGGDAAVVRLDALPGAWSMAMSKLLGDLFKHDALTLFPLPRAPRSWMHALEDGRVAQQDVRFQVFASNTLRELRQKGQTPVAILSAHENGEIRVTLGAEQSTEDWGGFVWPLSAQDRVETVQQLLVDLLHDCHHDDIRLVGDVLPSIKDGLPYFPLPVELVGAPAASAARN